MTKTTRKNNMYERILKSSIRLFAKTGYEGVSIRDVAVSVGLTPAALYYHFSSKEQLYVNTVSYAFREVTGLLKAAIEAAPTPLGQLESIIGTATKMLAKNRPLVRLIQWVKLDASRQGPKKAAIAALDELFLSLHKVVAELGSPYNPTLLVGSIASLVVFPFEVEDTFRFLPDYHSENTDPAVLTKHVVRLLRLGLTAGEPEG